MARKLQFETEEFKHFVTNLRETFWGDVYSKTKQRWKEVIEGGFGGTDGELPGSELVRAEPRRRASERLEKRLVRERLQYDLGDD